MKRCREEGYHDAAGGTANRLREFEPGNAVNLEAQDLPRSGVFEFFLQREQKESETGGGDASRHGSPQDVEASAACSAIS